MAKRKSKDPSLFDSDVTSDVPPPTGGDDVVALLADGDAPPGVTIERREAARVVVEDGRMVGLGLADGTVLDRTALFVAAAVVYVTYWDALASFDGGVRQVLGDQGTARIFATYPQPFLTPVIGGLVDQIVGTALLMLCVFALTDHRNCAPVAYITPVLVGAVILTIGIAFGFNSGYAINPARDFGPRLFTFVAGWGTEVFRAGHCWWWIPIVGPLIGGVLGGWVYDVLITRRHPPEADLKQAL